LQGDTDARPLEILDHEVVIARGQVDVGFFVLDGMHIVIVNQEVSIDVKLRAVIGADLKL